MLANVYMRYFNPLLITMFFFYISYEFETWMKQREYYSEYECVFGRLVLQIGVRSISSTILYKIELIVFHSKGKNGSRTNLRRFKTCWMRCVKYFWLRQIFFDLHSVRAVWWAWSCKYEHIEFSMQNKQTKSLNTSQNENM